jgi:hypothetical protein
MSIAAGSNRIGRTSRAGSSRPGVIGRAIGGARRLAGAVGARGARGAHHRRARGITARELRGFRKVTRLLRTVGMRPKGLGGHRRK